MEELTLKDVLIVLVVFVMFCVVTYFIFTMSREYKKDKQEKLNKLKLLGYSDIPDIEVFLLSTEYDLDDFIASKSLRKQYDLFVEGHTTEFIQNAQNKKTRDDGKTTSLVTGLAIGTVLGNMNK